LRAAVSFARLRRDQGRRAEARTDVTRSASLQAPPRAIARALVGGPKILLLDEPLEGLAPIIVENLFAALLAIRNLLTGFLEPDDGRIELWGQSLRGLRPEQRVRRGLVRTHQDKPAAGR
jgi:ABC-type branched-subunit amino acid transport system ATPase component